VSELEPAAERAHLQERLLEAEQDERRRIALFLHDGPVQNLAGIALMLDAAVHSIEAGEHEQALAVIRSVLGRQRETIRELRDLSFALEPVVLRDQGFGPAAKALAEQLGTSNEVRIDLDVAYAEELGQNTQAAVYTIVRECLDQSIRRGAERISVRISATGRGSTEIVVTDDGAGERRRRIYEAIEERARQLLGSLEIESDGGTTIRVLLPSHSTHR
jgi:two-component system NarL family sensor kinase